MVSTLRARLSSDLGEYLIVAATDPAARVPGVLRFADESDALRFLDRVEAGGGAQAIGQLYYNLTVGGNNEFNQREVLEAVAKQLAFGSLCAVPVSAIEDAEARPEAAGINPDHARRLEKFCKDRQYLMIIRAGNVESMKYQDEAGNVSKNKDVKLKTAKPGQPNAGRVVRPAGPESSWKPHEQENWAKLKEKGYQFDKDNLLRDPQGNAIHGDYDVQGVYQVTHDGYYNQIPVDEILDALNREVTPERRMFQHGANDDGAGFTEPGPGSNTEGNVMDYVTMPDGRVVPLMWRRTEDDERFLTVQPTGLISVLQNAWELKTFLEARGLTWLYAF
jgi:hypothetical protein